MVIQAVTDLRVLQSLFEYLQTLSDASFCFKHMRFLNQVNCFFLLLLREIPIFPKLLAFEYYTFIVCKIAPDSLECIIISDHLIEVDHVEPVLPVAFTHFRIHKVVLGYARFLGFLILLLSLWYLLLSSLMVDVVDFRPVNNRLF